MKRKPSANMVHSMMLTFLLASASVLQPAAGCIGGFRFVPPSSLVIEPVLKLPSTASKACVPCRGELSRFLWPSSVAPCCDQTETKYLTNATGEQTLIIFLIF